MSFPAEFWGGLFLRLFCGVAAICLLTSCAELVLRDVSRRKIATLSGVAALLLLFGLEAKR